MGFPVEQQYDRLRVAQWLKNSMVETEFAVFLKRQTGTAGSDMDPTASELLEGSLHAASMLCPGTSGKGPGTRRGMRLSG